MLLLQEPEWNKNNSVTIGTRYGTEAVIFDVR